MVRSRSADHPISILDAREKALELTDDWPDRPHDARSNDHSPAYIARRVALLREHHDLPSDHQRIPARAPRVYKSPQFAVVRSESSGTTNEGCVQGQVLRSRLREPVVLLGEDR